MNTGIWQRLFLVDRPSIGLSFFRIFVALTVGLHVLPSFFQLSDNYLAGAFKSVNTSFFTPEVLSLIAASPDWLVRLMVGVFCLSCFFFLIGFYSQISCILLTASCYYFYALNAFHIGTLSWDILLVTMFLMCVTGYHGDYFSIDALRRNDPLAYRRERPFFIQRLLQYQIAVTFFCTALHKITGEGNWLSGNPIYALMHYPPDGVTKYFLLRDWMASHPQFCYGMGIFVVCMELVLPFLWFIPRTRRGAIILGVIFHVMLILTLDVPTIFFFLFPAQMLLFINPAHIVHYIDQVRSRSVKFDVLYDGDCGFCQASVDRLKVMDLWGHLVFRPSTEAIHEVKFIDGAMVYGGFAAFRRLCWLLPMLYPLILFVYLPGVSLVGNTVYRWVARNRYLFGSASCKIKPHDRST